VRGSRSGNRDVYFCGLVNANCRQRKLCKLCGLVNANCATFSYDPMCYKVGWKWGPGWRAEGERGCALAISFTGGGEGAISAFVRWGLS